MDVNITKIIRVAQENRASDIHVVVGLPVRFRIDGLLKNYGQYIMTEADCEYIAHQLMGDSIKKFQDRGEYDCARTIDGDIRCRINVFKQQGLYSVAIRLLSDSIPSFQMLGLPPVVEAFPSWQRGIILVTGETGAGKSTTMAAMIERINQTRPQHIITLEDPIEYVYTPAMCTINQREVGSDTESFETGLRAVLREDPDVIMLGEMRDLETIETALIAAETGHLVLATLHTKSAPETIDRIVNIFPAGKQQQIRLQLSMSLNAVLSQQLIPRKNTEGRVLAYEVMINNPAIANLIREGKTPQIYNSMLTNQDAGNVTMDSTLVRLAQNGIIEREHAVNAAYDAEAVGLQLNIGTSFQQAQPNAYANQNMQKRNTFYDLT